MALVLTNDERTFGRNNISVLVLNIEHLNGIYTWTRHFAIQIQEIQCGFVQAVWETRAPGVGF